MSAYPARLRSSCKASAGEKSSGGGPKASTAHVTRVLTAECAVPGKDTKLSDEEPGYNEFKASKQQPATASVARRRTSRRVVLRPTACRVLEASPRYERDEGTGGSGKGSAGERTSKVHCYFLGTTFIASHSSRAFRRFFIIATLHSTSDSTW